MDQYNKEPERTFLLNTAMITKQKSRPRCKNCKIALVKPNGKSKHGFQLWHKYCTDCAKALYSEKYKHLINKNTVCAECNFEAIDRCQLDLVYIDGDKSNKSIDNLVTLCANCSRLYSKKLKSDKKSILNITVDNGDIRI